MNSRVDIPSDYLESGDKGTDAPTRRSSVKEFLKSPIEEGEMRKYGTSKPHRKIVRAKLIHD